MKNDSSCQKKKFCKDFSYTDKLKLYKCNAPICEILSYDSDICIKKQDIIETCCGYRLAVKGIKIVKICYTSNDCEGKVRYQKFCIPFFESFPINSCMKIINVTPDICYCDIDLIDCYTVYFYNIISLNVLAIVECVEPKLCCPSKCDCCNKCDERINFKNDCCCCNSTICSNSNVIFSPSNKNCPPYCNYNECNSRHFNNCCKNHKKPIYPCECSVDLHEE